MKCPRWDYCSVPLCPLEMGKRTYIEGEPKCTLPKGVRKRLGKELPSGGMFKREIASSKSYAERVSKGTSKIGKFAFKKGNVAYLGKKGARRGN